MRMSQKRRNIQNMLRRRFGWSSWQRSPRNPEFELPKEKGLSWHNGRYKNGKAEFQTDYFMPRIEIGATEYRAGGLEYTFALDRYIEEDGQMRRCQSQVYSQESQHCCFWFRMSFDEVKALYEMGLEIKKEEEPDA